MMSNLYWYCCPVVLAAACGIRTAGEHQLASLRTPIMPCLRIKIVFIISSKYAHSVAACGIETAGDLRRESGTIWHHRGLPSCHAFASISSSKYSSFYPAAARGIKLTFGILRTAIQGLFIHYGIKIFSGIKNAGQPRRERQQLASLKNAIMPSCLGIKMVFMFQLGPNGKFPICIAIH